MTEQQQQLIDTLASRKISAKFNGPFLNGKAVVTKANGKKQTNRFGIEFDDPATLEGPRVMRNLKGTYAEGFARTAFFECLRIGQGDDVAIGYINACRETGTFTGATQEFVDAHSDQIAPIGGDDE